MNKKINLFCLPFAGGNRYSYRQYQEKQPNSVSIVPVEYAGRGSRITEPLLSNITEIVADVFKQIKERINEGSYAIYGHSMGALVGFELIHLIASNNLRLPLHFFVTGTSAPSSKSRATDKWHLLSHDLFIQKLKDLEGCPEEIFVNTELLDFFVPIIRSDFKAIESFVYTTRPAFNIPVTVITGTEEKLKEEDILLWQKETQQQVDFIKMPGKHFFINSCAGAVLEIIDHTLKSSSKYLQHELD